MLHRLILARLVGPVALACALMMANAGAAAAVIHPGNYTTAFNTATVAAGQAASATATCPSGDEVVTGGAYWHRLNQNGDKTLRASIRSSAPNPNTLGWYAAGKNDSSEVLYLTSVAQCLPKSAVGTYTIKTRDVVVDPNRGGNADLRCKSGQRIVIGGAIWHKPGASPKASLVARLNGSFPDRDGLGWSASGWNYGTSTLDLRVTALCVPASALSGAYVVQEDFFFVASGDSAERYMACPGGDLAVGGGLYWQHNTGRFGDPPDTATPNPIVSSTITGDGTSWYAAAQHSATSLETSSQALIWEVLCLPA